MMKSEYCKCVFCHIVSDFLLLLTPRHFLASHSFSLSLLLPPPPLLLHFVNTHNFSLLSPCYLCASSRQIIHDHVYRVEYLLASYLAYVKYFIRHSHFEIFVLCRLLVCFVPWLVFFSSLYSPIFSHVIL